jgi:hypothetical protein
VVAAAWLAAVFAAAIASAAEPELPPGLEAPDPEPALPPGLEAPAAEPALPSGLEGLPEPSPERAAEPETADRSQPGPLASLPFQLTGFLDGRGGGRLRRDPRERRAALGETRLRLEAEHHLPGLSLRAATDFLYDALADGHRIDLESGDGFLDLREANAVFSPTGFTDAKVGRQVVTWGTGDLIFINDLFPKDWRAFFLGRDVDYLKAPSDALKLSAFTEWANLDVVYTPAFDADRFLDGRRVSFFRPALGRLAGRDAIVAVERPAAWFRDDEWALRLYRGFGAYEGALYGYHGFWKSPAGVNPASGRATFPPLSVLGASLRGPLARGIANLEFGYYDSRRDRAGANPNVRNGELRLVLGYEQEIARDLTLGLQYYVERMLDHGAYLRTLPRGAPVRDRNRHVLTQRLTWLTMNQDLAWSLFVFVSPSDADAYLRPHVTYKASDNLSVEAGGNLFVGRSRRTFFGQFENNSNLYLGLRYGF